MHYSHLTQLQQNALLAISVAGWQWVEWDFDDCSLPNQRWLLPSVAARHDVTHGEWMWYIEEEEIYPEGSPFPLPHKDARMVPGWFPEYFQSLESAFQLASVHFAQVELCKYPIESYSGPYRGYVSQKTEEDGKRVYGNSFSSESPAIALCEAMLIAKGVINEYGQLLKEIVE